MHTKTTEEALELIEIVAYNKYLYSSERTIKGGVMELDTLDTILAQNKVMSQQIASLTKQIGHIQVSAVGTQVVVCNLCGGAHKDKECVLFQGEQATIEQVNYMKIFQKPPPNDPFSKTYNLRWKNHPNFS
ncbi:uncharacterized protein DS421_13g409590 [Arachis hypogaea]|nr:uncharacterized protein DS421_13g409590 [Arachis hypogaea]